MLTTHSRVDRETESLLADSSGTDSPSTDLPGSDSLQKLPELYRQMAIARAIDVEAIAMQRTGHLPAYPPQIGQEAAQIGSGVAIDLELDFAFPSYRELGVAVAMGVDLVGYMATHLGTWHGGQYDPQASRFAPIQAVVAGSVLHAVGWAMGQKLDGTRGCAVAYFGDGASSQGDVHEAMNFAGVYTLPVVFFCQNNGWAISVPTKQQVAGGSVAARAASYGLASEQVDGNDVAAVYEATRRALDRARSGGGATVIEAMTYRIGPHATSDDPGRYRPLDEEQAWRARDPLTLCEKKLREANLADDSFFEAARTEAKGVSEEVRSGILNLADRPANEMFDFVYANPTAALLEQQEKFESGDAE